MHLHPRRPPNRGPCRGAHPPALAVGHRACCLRSGFPVESATDRQLIEWRDELEQIIRRSPIATKATDQIVALDAAIAEGLETADRLGTSARAQVQLLRAQREHLTEHTALRVTWLEENGSVFHRYSAVAEEIRHRINARVAACEVLPPEDVLVALGVPPTDEERRRLWTSAVNRYAESRMTLGETADLSDSALLSTPAWREAVAVYRSPGVPCVESPDPVLRRAM